MNFDQIRPDPTESPLDPSNAESQDVELGDEEIEGNTEGNKALIELAKVQIAELAPELKKFIATIETENPDAVVFLDKGARIFATPIHSYLHKQQKKTPEFLFLNDDEIKKAYLTGDDEAKLSFAKKYANLANKKILILDEAFSVGRGAIAVLELAERIGIEARYIALSKASGNFSNFSNLAVSFSEHLAKYNQYVSNGKIRVGNPCFDKIFSQRAARIYIKENRSGEIKPLLRGPGKRKSHTVDAQTIQLLKRLIFKAL
jgi:adenine/guanine phosphoribosyltransferase-like PRPP-binding protein